MLAFTEQRLRVIVALCLFAGLSLAATLWLTKRFYELILAAVYLARMADPFDAILYGAMILLAVIIVFFPKATQLMGLSAVFGFSLALFDQSRWQPWFYMYFSMIALIGWYLYRGEAFEENTSRR